MVQGIEKDARFVELREKFVFARLDTRNHDNPECDIFHVRDNRVYALVLDGTGHELARIINVASAKPAVDLMASVVAVKPAALTGIELLMRLMDSKDRLMRQDAVELAGRLGKKAAPATKRLTALLADRSGGRSVALSASTSLGRIGPDAAEAISSLVDVVDDEDAALNLRRNAASVLSKIDPDGGRVLAALIRAIESHETVILIGGADGLIDLGPRARSAAPAVEARLKRPCTKTARGYLERVLKAIG